MEYLYSRWKMKFYNLIQKNQLLRLNRSILIEKSSVNERLKAIIKEKLKDPET